MPSANGVPTRPFASVMAGLCLGAALAAVAFPAGAEEAPERLVLLVDPGVPTLARRLQEEVEVLGLEVRLVRVVEPDVPLETRARSSGAVAAIRIAPSGKDAIEMTIVDRATGKTVQRRLAIATPSDPASAELIATRTVELLRASLMELEATHPARGDVVVPSEVKESVARETRGGIDYSLGVGPALVVGTGAPASANAWLLFRLKTRSGFGAAAEWLTPFVASELHVSEGTVELSATQYRLAVFYETPSFGPGFSLRALTGPVLVHLALEGRASEPYVGESDDLVAFGPWLATELRFGLTRELAVLLRGDASVTFPELVIRSAGREVETWGRTLGTGAIGVELTW